MNACVQMAMFKKRSKANFNDERSNYVISISRRGFFFFVESPFFKKVFFRIRLIQPILFGCFAVFYRTASKCPSQNAEYRYMCCRFTAVHCFLFKLLVILLPLLSKGIAFTKNELTEKGTLHQIQIHANMYKRECIK